MKLRLFWKGRRFGLPYDEYLIKSFSFDGVWLYWDYLDLPNHSGQTKIDFVYKFQVVEWKS